MLQGKVCPVLERDDCKHSRCCRSPWVHMSCNLTSLCTVSTVSSFPLHRLFWGLLPWRTFLFSLLTGSQYYIIQFSVIPLIQWDIFKHVPLGLVFQLPDAWQTEAVRMPCKILKSDWTAAQTAWVQQHSYPPFCELVAAMGGYLCFHPRWIKNE